MEFNIQTMLYEKKENSDYIRILGEYFCRNNKNKGKLIINNKKYYLKEFIEIKNMKEKRIKIKMLINKNLYDKSYMFNDCESLLELTINDNLEYIKNYENSEAIDFLFEKNEYDNISEEGGEIFYENQENNESNEFDMDYFGIEDNNTFYENYSNNISEIKRDTKENEEDSSLIDRMKLFESQYNYSNLKYLFYNCSSLSSLPDISKWNINNVTNISWMFANCSSLSLLPDISEWNTSNVTDMSGLFYGCSSLSSLPDISKWNTNNINNMSDMFSNCSSLSYQIFLNGLLIMLLI